MHFEKTILILDCSFSKILHARNFFNINKCWKQSFEKHAMTLMIMKARDPYLSEALSERPRVNG